jgi:hypothetical protein
MCSFQPGFLLEYPGNAAIIPGKLKKMEYGKKSQMCGFFSKFFNIIVHKLPA